MAGVFVTWAYVFPSSSGTDAARPAANRPSCNLLPSNHLQKYKTEFVALPETVIFGPPDFSCTKSPQLNLFAMHFRGNSESFLCSHGPELYSARRIIGKAAVRIE